MLKLVSNKVKKRSSLIERLAAAGLSRILDKMLKERFAILSASREGLSPEENVQRSSKLKELLRGMGYGFIDLKGSYLYEETQIPVQEDSVFVTGVGEAEIRDLAEHFNQESYIFGDRAMWEMKHTATGQEMFGGSVADTFQPLHKTEVGENFPFLSQMRSKPGNQFRLHTELPDEIKSRQEEELWSKHRVAFRVVKPDPLYFYSLFGDLRAKPPVSAQSSGVGSGKYPVAGLLECWLPLIEKENHAKGTSRNLRTTD